MKNMGVHSFVGGRPHYEEVFLLIKDEAEELQQVLDTTPVKLDLQPGQHGIPKKLIPGNFPFELFKEVDFGTVTQISRSNPLAWEVHYRTAEDQGRALEKGERCFYPRVKFKFERSDEGNILRVNSFVGFSWVPRDASLEFGTDNLVSSTAGRDNHFLEIVQEYFDHVYFRDNKRIGINATDGSYEGINFAPSSLVRELIGGLEHIMDHLSQKTLLRLHALHNGEEKVSKVETHGYAPLRDVIKQTAEQMEGAYWQGIKTVARELREVKYHQPSKPAAEPVLV